MTEKIKEISMLLGIDSSKYDLLEQLDYIRACIKYLLFEEEASKREITSLKE